MKDLFIESKHEGNKPIQLNKDAMKSNDNCQCFCRSAKCSRRFGRYNFITMAMQGLYNGKHIVGEQRWNNN